MKISLKISDKTFNSEKKNIYSGNMVIIKKKNYITKYYRNCITYWKKLNILLFLFKLFWKLTKRLNKEQKKIIIIILLRR